MTGKFTGGVCENVHVKGKKLRHLRIRAGKHRGIYVHDLVFQAKILGRREAWMAINTGQPVPDTEFYRYIDTTFETVDHDNNDSLDNEPENLVRMSRAENSAKANRLRAVKRKEQAEKRAARKVAKGIDSPEVPF